MKTVYSKMKSQVNTDITQIQICHLFCFVFLFLAKTCWYSKTTLLPAPVQSKTKQNLLSHREGRELCKYIKIYAKFMHVKKTHTALIKVCPLLHFCALITTVFTESLTLSHADTSTHVRHIAHLPLFVYLYDFQLLSKRAPAGYLV